MLLVSSRGEVRHPLTDEVLAPGRCSARPRPATGQDPREALAEWITSDDNPFFAR